MSMKKLDSLTKVSYNHDILFLLKKETLDYLTKTVFTTKSNNCCKEYQDWSLTVAY